MNSVLVTGGAGFIGSHLCEKLLELGCSIINIDNFDPFYDPQIKRDNISSVLTNSQYTLVTGDIRDTALLDSIFKKYRIDTVVHLAALAGVRKSIDSPLDYVDVDIKGTVNLLEASRKYTAKKFVFASSSSVYGSSIQPCKENDCVNLQMSPYAAAKLSGELFCATYNSLYKLPIVCLRFFTVYGPRQRPEMAVHKFTRLIWEGKEVPIFSNGKSYRDYTFIDDIIDGIVRSIELKCNFEIFNLGNSKPIQLDQLINLLEHKIGKPAYKRYLPSQKSDVECTCADITKAKSLLGYEPAISIDKGIERFVDWFKHKTI